MIGDFNSAACCLPQVNQLAEKTNELATFIAAGNQCHVCYEVMTDSGDNTRMVGTCRHTMCYLCVMKISGDHAMSSSKKAILYNHLDIRPSDIITVPRCPKCREAGCFFKVS